MVPALEKNCNVLRGTDSGKPLGSYEGCCCHMSYFHTFVMIMLQQQEAQLGIWTDSRCQVASPASFQLATRPSWASFVLCPKSVFINFDSKLKQFQFPQRVFHGKLMSWLRCPRQTAGGRQHQSQAMLPTLPLSRTKDNQSSDCGQKHRKANAMTLSQALAKWSLLFGKQKGWESVCFSLLLFFCRICYSICIVW